MSSSAEEAPEGGEAPPPPGGKPPKVLVALLGVNLLLTGLVAFKTMTAKPPKQHEAKPEPPKHEVTGKLVALDPFVVNLNEPGSARYLKVTMQAEVSNAAAVKVFEKSKQLIRDEMLRYLSGLKVADTLGPENKDHIREDLEAAVSEVIGENRLHRMIFAEFVVQ
jgi:flagellar basal body-associated protein FliL